MPEPINIEFVLKGNLEEEVDRVRMSVKRMGNEGAKSYQSLLAQSNEAFKGMSQDAQSQAVSLQKTITQMRKAEQAQASLKEEYEEGKISSSQYAQASARLSVQQAQLKSTASQLSAELQQEIQMNNQVEGSYNQMVTKLKQLKETYKQLSAEERNNDEIGGQMLQTIKKLENETGKFEESLKGLKTASATSIDGMKQKLSELEKRYNSLSKEERNNKQVGGALRQEMTQLKGSIDQAEMSNRGFVDSLENAPGAIGQTVSGLKQMTVAALRFIATPIGAIIAAIVVGIKALTTWFRRGSEGQRAFAKVSAYFSQILNEVLNIAAKVGEWLYKAFTEPKKALDDLVDFMKGQLVNRFNGLIKFGQSFLKIFSKDWKEGLRDLGSAFVQVQTGVVDAGKKIAEYSRKVDEAASRQARLAEELYNLDLRDLETREKVAKMDLEISNLRARSRDRTRDEQKNLNDINRAMELRAKTAKMEIEDLKERLQLTREKLLLENGVNDVAKLNLQNQKTLNELEVKIIEKQKAKSEMIRTLLDQRNAIIGRLNREKDIQDQIREELKQKKDAYQNYYKFVTATDKQTANQMFQELTQNADSYLEYLDKKIKELEAKGNRTKRENTELVVFTSERQNLLGTGDEVDALKKEMQAKKKAYEDDVLAFRQYLQQKLQAIDETSEMGYKQKVIVEVELEATDEAYKEKLQSLLKEYGSFTTQMMSLRKDYEDKKRILEAEGTDEAKRALENLTAEYKKAVMELKNQNNNYLRTIFGDFDKLSMQAIERLKRQTEQALESAKEETVGERTFMLVDVQKMNEDGEKVSHQVRLTVDEFDKLREKYEELEEIFREKNPFKALSESWEEMIEAFKEGDDETINEAVSGFNDALDSSIAYVEQFRDVFNAAFGEEAVDATMELTKGMANLGQGIARVAAGDLSGITAIAQGGGQIFETIYTGAQRAREAEAEWMNTLLGLQREYNSVLNEQIRTQTESGIFMTDYVAQIKAGWEALEDAQANFFSTIAGGAETDVLSGFADSYASSLDTDFTGMLENTLADLKVKIGTEKKKILGITIGSKDVYGNLLEEYPELITQSGEFNTEVAETILGMQSLGDETRNTLEDLVEYQSQIDEARQQIDSAIESMAGNISDDLHGALRDAWESGADSFQAFKESVSQGLQEIMSQMLFNEIFSDQFEQLGQDMKDSFDPVTGDDTILDDFERFLDAAPELVEDWEQGMTDLESALSDAGISIEDLKQNLTGTTADSIAESIAQGFANGYSSAAYFADNFESMMKKAILESLKVKILEDQLNNWYEAFAASMEGGTLAQDMQSLQEDYNTIINSAADYITAMEEATGLDFEVNQEGDKNSINKVTEETASKLEGHFIAVRINTGRLVETTEHIMSQMAAHQLHLVQIEKNTNELSRLEAMETILKRLEQDGIKLKN